MDEKYSKSNRINRYERKKNKDNVYNSKHIRIALRKQNNAKLETNNDKPISNYKKI